MGCIRIATKFLKRLWSKIVELFRRITQRKKLDDWHLDAALILKLEEEFKQLEKDCLSSFKPTGRLIEHFDVHSRIRAWHFAGCGNYAASAQRNGEDTKAAVYIFDTETEESYEYGEFSIDFTPVIMYWLDENLVVIGLTERVDGYWLRQELLLLNHQTRNAEGFAPRLYSFHELGTSWSFANYTAQYGETVTIEDRCFVPFCIEDDKERIVVRYLPRDLRPAAPFQSNPLGFTFKMQALHFEENGLVHTSTLHHTPIVWNNKLHFPRWLSNPDPHKYLLNRYFIWDLSGMKLEVDAEHSITEGICEELTATVAPDVDLNRVTRRTWRHVITNGNRFTFVEIDGKSGGVTEVLAYNIDTNTLKKLDVRIERDDSISAHPSGNLIHWFHDQNGRLYKRIIEEDEGFS